MELSGKSFGCVLWCALGLACGSGSRLEQGPEADRNSTAAVDGAGSLHDGAEAQVSSPASLRVMTFNVLIGGMSVDFAKVIEAVAASGADVVALEETYGNSDVLAAALGWPYVSERTDVIARFPLVDPPEAGGKYVWAEVAPGQVVAVGNVHLPPEPYAPYFTSVCPESALLQLEREARLPALAPLLQQLTPLAADGMPVFLVGDFNAPSHLDWTPETVGERPHLTYPVRWPVSVALEEAGFIDSYRAIHPDPKAWPGLTWWAGLTSTDDRGLSEEPRDRIDLVLAAGPARAQNSEIVGEAGAPGVDIGISPWPSDHRAVVSTFTVEPALAPMFVTVDQRLVALGDPVRVHFYSYGGSAERIVLSPHDVTSGRGRSRPLPEIRLDSAQSSTGRIELPTSNERTGGYDVQLLSAEGEILAQTSVWLTEPGAELDLTVDRRVYASGDPILLSWSGAPGNRSDWVGLCRAPVEPGRTHCLVWDYVDAQVEGSIVLDASSGGGELWPLSPGDYEAAFFLYGSYDIAARVPFRVKGDLADGVDVAAARWDAECTAAP